MSTKKRRIGVLGAGHLGRIHIQQVLEIPGWDLIGFHDPDADKCANITAEFGARSFATPEELLAECEALDIVTPTLSHFAMARLGVAAGKHLFIEKPLTETVQEAEKLLGLVEGTPIVVQVGHVERFNPAFIAALPYFNDPMFIETHRLAQFNPRGTDVSVVLDLMIHDLDIVLHVVGSPVATISASGVAVVSDTPDICNARITFANGCVANLTASRISLKNMRKSRFFQRDAYIGVDMLKKETEIVRMRTVEGEPDPFAVTLDLGAGKGAPGDRFDKPEIQPTNAIREELRAFLGAVNGEAPPPVSLSDGHRALATAHAVLEQLEASFRRIP